MALGIGQGDEVVTSASPSRPAEVMRGGTTRYSRRRGTRNIDPKSVEAKTIPHQGVCRSPYDRPRMDAITRRIDTAAVSEDAAQSFGATMATGAARARDVG